MNRRDEYADYRRRLLEAADRNDLLAAAKLSAEFYECSCVTCELLRLPDGREGK